MTEKDRLVIKVLHLAYLVHVYTQYCVFIRFAGHVGCLLVDIRKSKDDWQNEQFKDEMQIEYRQNRKSGDDPIIAELRGKIAILEHVLKDGEVPWNKLKYEEEIVRTYTF